MNILLTSLQVPGSASGVRIHYERLADMLRADGHRVQVLTQADLHPWVRRAIGGMRRALELLGPLGKRVGLELSQVVEIYCAIGRRPAYDVVNAQDVASGWAAHLALGGRVPVVVTGHFHDHPGQEVIKQLALPPDSLTAHFEMSWFNFLLKRTRHFLSISQYALGLARPYLPAQVCTAIAYNGVDMQAFRPPATPAITSLRTQFPGRPIILNIGQLEPRKNQRYLLDVIAELRKRYPTCLLALAGQGEDEQFLRTRITELGLVDNVVLLGYCSQVAPLLHAADLYVHTATHENCPYALVEAMGAGCPVVALVAGGSPELLAATPEVSLPQSTSPAALATQLADLLDDDAARRALQQRQYEYAHTRFDRVAMLRDTLAFYRQAAGVLATEPAPVLQPA